MQVHCKQNLIGVAITKLLAMSSDVEILHSFMYFQGTNFLSSNQTNKLKLTFSDYHFILAPNDGKMRVPEKSNLMETS